MLVEIENKKLELIHWITETDDDNAIIQMYNNIQFDSEGWHYSVTEEEKESIKAGREDIKEGRTKPHNEVMKIFKKYG